MTLISHLDDSSVAALDAHRAATGATKSHVVQQSLVAYLERETANAAAAARPSNATAPGTVFTAFDRASLIGGAPVAVSADKAAVRHRIDRTA